MLPGECRGWVVVTGEPGGTKKLAGDGVGVPLWVVAPEGMRGWCHVDTVGMRAGVLTLPLCSFLGFPYSRRCSPYRGLGLPFMWGVVGGVGALGGVT